MKKIIIVIALGVIGAFGLFVVTIRIMADKPKETTKAKTADNNEFQNGDIIFQTSKSSQSKAIQLATNSKYSLCFSITENQVLIRLETQNDKKS